ncbi:hypothetical protein AAF712_003996 [Marasmius tenuissimus]|uniref:Actin-related protein n=1 Tax=Marasmius tenuissimus TaxID=585030 RepID=A0ABR3A7M6_9AGAR
MQAPIVIDTGSATCRAGFADETLPTVVVQTLTARPSDRIIKIAPQFEDVCLVGAEAFEKRGAFKLRQPVQDVIIYWSDIVDLWRHVYEKEMQGSEQRRALVLTESLSQPSEDRQKVLNILLNDLKVPSVYIQDTASLALHASDLSTGVVLDLGCDTTTCVAISDGIVLRETLQSTSFAGKALTEFLRVELMKRGAAVWTTTSETVRANEIREQVCFVKLNSDEAEVPPVTVVDKLGENVVIEKEQWTLGEALFNPSLAGSDALGIDRLVLDTISKAPKTLRSTLFQNIVLVGGTSKMKGLAARLNQELGRSTPEGVAVNVVHDQATAGVAAWVGATRLAWSDHDKLEGKWITKDASMLD